jgi:hypothetical protein
MTKPTRDATLSLDDIIAHSQHGYMFIAHDGAVVVRIVGVDELVEIDADTAVRYLGPKKAQQLIHAIAESLEEDQP